MRNEIIAVIGSGMCGLTVARLLNQIGHSVVVLDKGRAPGGRMATRHSRTGHQFDHGAQYIGAQSAAFQGVINGAVSTRAMASWNPAPGVERYVGAPGMVDFARHLGRALDIRQTVEVAGLEPTKSGWRLLIDHDSFEVSKVVMTCPAPQAARLLGDHPIADQLASITMIPCLTVMAAFETPGELDRPSLRDPDADLSWVALDSSKPGRALPAHYVGQAGKAFSRANLEADKPEIANMLLPILADRVGADVKGLTYLSGHRWRHARVAQSLGVPFLSDESGSLFVGGDWCLGARVEAAWESGTAIAEAIIGADRV